LVIVCSANITLDNIAYILYNKLQIAFRNRGGLVERDYQVLFFEKENGTFPAEEYINSLDDKLSAKVYRILAMIEMNGPELREPYSSHLDDGIFEVRARIGTNQARVLYFFIIGKRVIATHGFTKKTQKTPPAEIEKAKAYRKEFLEREAHKNENS